MLEAIRIAAAYFILGGVCLFAGLSTIYLARISATLTAMSEEEAIVNVHHTTRHPVA